jgi:parvulin-like peptidyl-prolyl isomerase
VRRLAPFLVALLLVAAGCSTSGGTGSANAATVNGTAISVSTLYDDLDALAADPDLRASFEQSGTAIYGPNDKSYTTAFAAGWLGQLIQAELVQQQLDSLGESANASDQSQAQQEIGQSIATLPEDLQQRLLESTANQIALQRVLDEQAAGQPLTDEELRAYFDERIDSLMEQSGGEVVCSSYASVAFDPAGQSPTGTPEQVAAANQTAQSIYDRVIAGETLDEVAASLAGDTVNSVRGGDLSCFGRGQSQLPPDLEEQLFTLTVGEVSEPIETEGAVVLFNVRSRGLLPFEEVESAIRQQLESDRGALVREQFVRDSTVDVDPRFGTFDVATAAVTPPEGPSSPTTAASLLEPQGIDPSGEQTP